MNIAELIAQMRAAMKAKIDGEREAARRKIEDLRALCAKEDRDPTEAEAETIRAAQADIAAVDAELATVQARIVVLEAEQASDEAADKLSRDLIPTGVSVDRRKKGGARILSEPRTYTRATSASGEARFFSDAWNAERGNTQAQDRLERHGSEVTVEGEISERALATGGVASLVIPQYLTELAAPVLRAGRAVANACNRHELPTSGMSLIIPRGTTGNSVAAQNGQNTAVSNTDQVWADLTVPVCTVSGQQPVSRQTLERGEGMDEIIFEDLARAYVAQLGNYVVNGSGAAGQPTGILSTGGINAAAALGAAPGIANVQLKIAGANTAVDQSGTGLFAKALFMAPRRWGWMTGLVDTANRPIVTVNQAGPQNLAALIQSTEEDDDPTALIIRGLHSTGIAVITDLNIPIAVGANSEDIIISADTRQLHLWEIGDGMPEQLSFEQTAGDKLTVTLVAYSYMAFTAGRYPTAISKIGGLDTVAGQGLVAPTF